MKFIHILGSADRAVHFAGKEISHKGLTVGYEFLDGDKRDENGNIVEVGPKKQIVATFARCSPKDTFNKKKSRLICQGRFAKGKKMHHFERPDDIKVYEFLLTKAVEFEKSCQEKAMAIIKQGRKFRKVDEAH